MLELMAAIDNGALATALYHIQQGHTAEAVIGTLQAVYSIALSTARQIYEITVRGIQAAVSGNAGNVLTLDQIPVDPTLDALRGSEPGTLVRYRSTITYDDPVLNRQEFRTVTVDTIDQLSPESVIPDITAAGLEAIDESEGFVEFEEGIDDYVPSVAFDMVTRSNSN